MSEMKLIIENWRYQTGKTDFNILCENFDRGLISEQILLETWERRMLMEADELLTEDLMNILKWGWEKGKELVGKAKKIYDAAVGKISDFFQNLCIQAWGMIQRIKEAFSPVVKVLKTIYTKVEKFCSVHPTICKIIKYTLLILAIAAVAFFVYNVLQQTQTPDAMGICEVCVDQGPDGKVFKITDTGIEAMKGFLGDFARAKSEDSDPQFQQTLADAYGYVQECSTSTDTMALKDAAGKAGPILEQVSKQLQEVAAEDPDLYRKWADLGKDVYVSLTRYTESSNIGGKVTYNQISFQSLELPPGR